MLTKAIKREPSARSMTSSAFRVGVPARTASAFGLFSCSRDVQSMRNRWCEPQKRSFEPLKSGERPHKSAASELHRVIHPCASQTYTAPGIASKTVAAAETRASNSVNLRPLRRNSSTFVIICPKSSAGQAAAWRFLIHEGPIRSVSCRHYLRVRLALGATNTCPFEIMETFLECLKGKRLCEQRPITELAKHRMCVIARRKHERFFASIQHLGHRFTALAGQINVEKGKVKICASGHFKRFVHVASLCSNRMLQFT